MSEQKTPFPFGKSLENAHVAQIDQSKEDIEKILNWIDGKKNILYFCGNVGTGKTFLCAAFYNFVKEKNKHIRAFTEYKLFGLLRAEIQKNFDPLMKIEQICESPYVILDDMGSSSMTEWQKEMLFEFVNIRVESGLPTLITSNMKKNDLLKTFHERFSSRIYAAKNTIIELNGEDRRQWKEKDGQ
mgnify:CR=1 FL=1|jgi:DNA replication protein DnaC|tara:strand:- start:744 stop:1301 length:558 start_codon:yes stop_codon:yes gene_type:complete